MMIAGGAATSAFRPTADKSGEKRNVNDPDCFRGWQRRRGSRFYAARIL